MMLEQLRREPLWHLPALIGLVLAGMAVPASSATRLAVLCSGGAIPLPGQKPDRACDQACHVGCSRPKKPISSGRL